MNSHPFSAVQHPSISVISPLVHHISAMALFTSSCSTLGEIEQISDVGLLQNRWRKLFFLEFLNLSPKSSLSYITNPSDPALVNKQRPLYSSQGCNLDIAHMRGSKVTSTL